MAASWAAAAGRDPWTRSRKDGYRSGQPARPTRGVDVYDVHQFSLPGLLGLLVAGGPAGYGWLAYGGQPRMLAYSRCRPGAASGRRPRLCQAGPTRLASAGSFRVRVPGRSGRGLACHLLQGSAAADSRSSIPNCRSALLTPSRYHPNYRRAMRIKQFFAALRTYQAGGGCGHRSASRSITQT